MTALLRHALLAFAVAATPVAWSAGSSTDGATKGAVCLACHSANGSVLSADWPVLAGQSATYVYGQLKKFHAGTRIDSTNSMPAMIGPLTDQDMQDIAAYYATLTPGGLEAEASSYQLGRKLYLGGDRARKVPACAACHGPNGAGAPASGYPALRAQSAVYTEKQLSAYLQGTRYTVNEKGESNGGDNFAIMHTISARLTAEEIKSLAAFLQGLR